MEMDERYDSILVHIGGDKNLFNLARIFGFDLIFVDQESLEIGSGVRLGWNVYDPDAEVYYSPRDSAYKIFHQEFPVLYQVEMTTIHDAQNRSHACEAAIDYLDIQFEARLLAVLPVLAYETQVSGRYQVMIEIVVNE